MILSASFSQRCDSRQRGTVLAGSSFSCSSTVGYVAFILESPDQPAFPKDAIHPAFRVVSERLEFAVEVGREHDAIREVLLEPFHFSLRFEIQTDTDFSGHILFLFTSAKPAVVCNLIDYTPKLT